jgi:hypothetical protein
VKLSLLAAASKAFRPFSGGRRRAIGAIGHEKISSSIELTVGGSNACDHSPAPVHEIFSGRSEKRCVADNGNE